MEIVNDPVSVGALLAQSQGQFPASELAVNTVAYHAAIVGKELQNTSFALTDGTAPVAICISMSESTGVSYFSESAEIEFALGPNPKAQAMALRMLGDYLASHVARSDYLNVCYQKSGTDVDELESRLLSAGLRPSPGYRASIDLRSPEDEILTSMRTAHRQSIRKGLRELGEPKLYFNGIPGAVFDSFRSLHLKAAGRITRSAESWDLMFAALLRGEASLATIEWQGEMIGACYCWVSTSGALYGTGAYDRDYFSSFPISHNLVYSSVRLAKELECSTFFVGQAYEPDGTDKQKGIAAFKRGFVSSVPTQNVFRSRDG